MSAAQGTVADPGKGAQLLAPAVPKTYIFAPQQHLHGQCKARILPLDRRLLLIPCWAFSAVLSDGYLLICFWQLVKCQLLVLATGLILFKPYKILSFLFSGENV